MNQENMAFPPCALGYGFLFRYLRFLQATAEIDEHGFYFRKLMDGFRPCFTGSVPGVLDSPEHSNVSRGKRKESEDDGVPCILEADKSSKEYRKNWARLIQKIYEVDPLTCPVE
jgi:hypothetical protein